MRVRMDHWFPDDAAFEMERLDGQAFEYAEVPQTGPLQRTASKLLWLRLSEFE